MKYSFFAAIILICGCQRKSIMYFENANLSKQQEFEMRSNYIVNLLMNMDSYDKNTPAAQAVSLIDSINAEITNGLLRFPSTERDISVGKSELTGTYYGQQLSNLILTKFINDSIYYYSPNLMFYHFENENWIEQFCYDYPIETKLNLSILKFELLIYSLNYLNTNGANL